MLEIKKKCTCDFRQQKVTKMEDYGDPTLDETEASMVTWIWTEITSSYLNICLTLAILYLVYKILFQKDEELVVNVEPPKAPMKKQVNQNNRAAY